MFRGIGLFGKCGVHLGRRRSYVGRFLLKGLGFKGFGLRAWMNPPKHEKRFFS